MNSGDLIFDYNFFKARFILNNLKNHFTTTKEIEHKLSAEIKKSSLAKKLLLKSEDAHSSKTNLIHKAISIFFVFYVWVLEFQMYNYSVKGYEHTLFLALIVTLASILFFFKPSTFNEIINFKNRSFIIVFLLVLYGISIIDLLKTNQIELNSKNLFEKLSIFTIPDDSTFFYFTVFFSFVLGIIIGNSSSYLKYKILYSSSIKNNKPLYINILIVLFLSILTFSISYFLTPHITPNTSLLNYILIVFFWFVSGVFFLIIAQSLYYLSLYKIAVFFDKENSK